MVKSVIKDLEKMMEFPKEGVFSNALAKTDISNHTLMCMGKGSEISEHTSTREASLTVLKGEGVFVLNGEKIKMKPGVFIFMPKDAPHSLSASKDLAILLSLSGKFK